MLVATSVLKQVDLTELATTYGVTSIVCLLNEAELRSIGVSAKAFVIFYWVPATDAFAARHWPWLCPLNENQLTSVPHFASRGAH
jgi:hypothetical protein